MGIINKSRFIAPTRPIVGLDNGLSIVILASNANYRMRSHGACCMIRDRHGVTLLEHQVAIFQTEFPKAEIIVVGGFEIDKLLRNKPNSVRVVENIKYEQSGEVEDLRLALNNCIYENLLIVFGDLYFSLNLIKGITKTSSLVVDSFQRMVEDDVGLTVVDGQVTILSMSLKDKKWGKIAFLKNREFKILKQFVDNRTNEKLFVFEALNHLLESGGKFVSHEIKRGDMLIHVDNTDMLKLYYEKK